MLLLAASVRSFISADTIAFTHSRTIPDSTTYGREQAWGVVLEIARGGARLEWRRAQQMGASSVSVLAPQTVPRVICRFGLSRWYSNLGVGRL